LLANLPIAATIAIAVHRAAFSLDVYRGTTFHASVLRRSSLGGEESGDEMSLLQFDGDLSQRKWHRAPVAMVAPIPGQRALLSLSAPIHREEPVVAGRECP
jgi:hypothetical protein